LFARRFLSALAGCALLLAGCAVPPALSIGSGKNPTASSAIEPGSFRAPDGTILPMRSWLPKDKPSALIIALHGFADYSEAFRMPADYWASRGVAVFAFDQRGFGGAPHTFHWAGAATMAADVKAFAALLRARYPGIPLYLLGESMGGAVAITATDEPKPADVDGLILVSPAVWEHGVMGIIERSTLMLADFAAPGLWLEAPRGLGIHPTNNVAMLKSMAHDSLIQVGARADTTAGLMDLMDQAGAEVDRLRLPALVLFGAHEEVLPRAGVQGFLRRLPAANVRVALYPDGYHMLLRDLHGALVWDDVLAWIGDRNADLPSGAECAAAAALSPPCRDRRLDSLNPPRG